MLNICIDPSDERKIVDLRKAGVHDVPALGRYTYLHAHQPLEGHTHGNACEICYLDEGRQTYIASDEEFILEGGDVLVTFPNEIHGTGPSAENRGRLYWLIVRIPEPRERFLNLPPAEARQLVEALLSVSPRKFKARRSLKHHLEQIFRVHDENAPFMKAEIGNWALRFILDMLAAANRTTEDAISPTMRQVQAYIEENLFDAPPQLATLAETAGLSLSRFKARFRQEVGQSPGHFIVSRKIEAAKELLRSTDRSNTSIAMDLGFSCSQYFATVFKKHTRLTPSAFRRQSRKSTNSASQIVRPHTPYYSVCGDPR